MKKATIILLTLICVMNCVGKKVEITSDEISISKIPKKLICERAFEMPKDNEIMKVVQNALCMVENEVSRIQYMIDKGIIKKSYWNGIYTGLVIIKDKKTKYCFSLRVKDDKIISFGQVNKEVYNDKINGKRDRSLGYIMRFYDNTNIIVNFSYGYIETRKLLSFYPNGNIKSCGMTFSNKFYKARWDESGKLISEEIKKMDWEKEEKRKLEILRRFKESKKAKIKKEKEYIKSHPELKKIVDDITETAKQLEEINKKLESDSYQESEIASMKAEQKVLNDKLKKSFSELKKVQKQIIKEEK